MNAQEILNEIELSEQEKADVNITKILRCQKNQQNKKEKA